jgi:protein-L-isoaspartate(D-aspartate) O-methyltransferase
VKTPDSRKLRLLLDLRAAGLTDARVLGAIERTPREVFVPEPFRDQAYQDVALPIGHHQTVSQPTTVALMTQALEISDRMKVLEIGTGSGFQAAVLARLCRRVYTVERHRALLREAEQRFRELRLHNITARLGDGAKGWPEQAPFERIIVTAAAAEVPSRLADQLAVGGLMVVPVGPSDDEQKVVRVRRTADGFTTESLWRVRFVPLVGGPVPE